MTFALFNSNIVLQTQNELKYLWVFCIYKILSYEKYIHTWIKYVGVTEKQTKYKQT